MLQFSNAKTSVDALTFVAFVGDLGHLNEVGSNHGVIYGVIVPQLDFNALTERWEHLRKNQLFVPNGGAAGLLHRCSSL